MNEVKNIVSDIKKGIIKPIYFLMGEEPYYIDKISDFIEETVLDQAEKGFNQQVMYGRDATIEDVVSAADWTIFNGNEFRSSVVKTIVNGEVIWSNGEFQAPSAAGKSLTFSRTT